MGLKPRSQKQKGEQANIRNYLHWDKHHLKTQTSDKYHCVKPKVELSTTSWVALSPIIPRLLLQNPRGSHHSMHGIICCDNQLRSSGGARWGGVAGWLNHKGLVQAAEHYLSYINKVWYTSIKEKTQDIPRSTNWEAHSRWWATRAGQTYLQSWIRCSNYEYPRNQSLQRQSLDLL